jgi:hypothetical protein
MISPEVHSDLIYRTASSHPQKITQPTREQKTRISPGAVSSGKQKRKKTRNKIYASSRFLLRYHFPRKVAIYFAHVVAGASQVASSENMAATKQFRDPSRIAPQPVVQPGVSALASGAFLSLRLWTDSAGSGPLFAADAVPAACFALDLVSASEGSLVESQEDILVAGFPSIQPAIAAARRLQWGIQGISETDTGQSTAVAALIQSAAEMSEGNSRELLDRSAPGQILLSERASHLYEKLPGVLLRPVNDAPLRELLWRGPDDQSTPLFDEQMFAHLLELQGLEYQPFEPPPALELDAFDPEPYQTGVAAPPESFTLSSILADPAKKRYVLIGLGVAAALLLIVLGLHFSHGGNTQPVTQPTGATTPQAIENLSPAANLTPSANAGSSPSQDRSKHATLPVAEKAKTPAGQSGQPVLPKSVAIKTPEPQPVQPPAPKVVEVPQSSKSNCDLDSSQIGGALDQAEKSLARGKYDAAQRQFRDVLACEPGNSRARSGLERVRQAREAED